jgi:hypothetical protein
LAFALHPIKYAAHPASVIVPTVNPVTKAQSVAIVEGLMQER